MATRRRYAAPRGYRDGGAVPMPDDLPQPVEIAQEPPGASADVTLSPAGDDPTADDALSRVLERQLRAEEMSRQPRQQRQEPETPDTIINAMPISDAKKDFLRQRPELLRSDHAAIVHEAHTAALEYGIEDDTPAMFRYLGDAVTEEMQARRERLANAARSAAAMQAPSLPEPTIERAAEQLGMEAEALGAIGNALDAMPASVGADFTPPATPAPPHRGRIPMVAPVSRDSMSYSGKPAGSGQVTLTPQEREIARNSFSDPNMSAAEKERSYAMQKARLSRLRADGLYPERERG